MFQRASKRNHNTSRRLEPAVDLRVLSEQRRASRTRSVSTACHAVKAEISAAASSAINAHAKHCRGAWGHGILLHRMQLDPTWKTFQIGPGPDHPRLCGSPLTPDKICERMVGLCVCVFSHLHEVIPNLRQVRANLHMAEVSTEVVLHRGAPEDQYVSDRLLQAGKKLRG